MSAHPLIVHRFAVTTLVVLGLFSVNPATAAPTAPTASAATAAAEAKPEPKSKTPSEPPTKAAQADALERAERHFASGVRLFQDQNYAGALAEFEAAYQLKPGKNSLQNIALSLKGLFRYAEAANALERLLEKHGSELSDKERQQVQLAISELNALVGSIVIQTEPKNAEVTLDGRTLSQAELASAIRLNVGEHTLTAKAPGYAPLTRTLRIAGGQKEIPVELKLEASAGQVTIVSRTVGSEILIDGQSVGTDKFQGPLSPGRHTIHVLQNGRQIYEQEIDVVAGKRYAVDVPAESTALEKAPPPDDTPKLPQRGFYGLLTLNGLSFSKRPEGIQATDGAAGGSLGLRGGYRFLTILGAELMIEGGSLSEKGACLEQQPSIGLVFPGCAQGDAAARVDYQVSNFRFGANVRLMSAGRSVRFTSALGLGVVAHRFKLSIDGEEQGSTTGADPFLMLEAGVQFNLAHFLLEVDGVAFLDGVNGLSAGEVGRASLFTDNSLPSFGLGLRGGWGQWLP